MRGVLRTQEEIAVQIYNAFGFRPFTLDELYAAIGNDTPFRGRTIRHMRNNKCITVLDREHFSKERRVITTYRLTMDVIRYLRGKGLIE